MREVSLKSSAFSEIAGEITQKGGRFCFRGHGSSMYPFIRNGSVLVVEPLDSDRLRIGDIVFYKNGKSAAVHRVVGKIFINNNKMYLLVRGDAFSGQPEIVPVELILGRILRAEHSGKIADFDKLFWRWAGIAWMKLTPFSQLLLWSYSFFKRIWTRLCK